MEIINSQRQRGVSGVLITIVIGVVIAIVSFFTAFITTQRASVPHPKSNLRLTIPPNPTKKPLPPLPALPSQIPIPQDTSISTETGTLNPGTVQIETEVPATSETAGQ